MRTAGIFEAKRSFSELLHAVEAGEEVRITRHGREIVRMLPVEPQAAARAMRSAGGDDLVEKFRALRARVKPGPGWKELRDGGRDEGWR